MEERGIDAMSRFDVEIAYGGNGQMALDQGKQLVSNHINYYSRRLEELGPEVRQMDLFGGLASAADIFIAEPDEHLEDEYDLSQGEGMDFDDDTKDYEPNPYDGTYSEE